MSSFPKQKWRSSAASTAKSRSPTLYFESKRGELLRVKFNHRPDFAYIYTTCRYAVHAAAGVTLNAGHVSDLGRGGGCIQPTTPLLAVAGPLPRVIPLVYDSWLAPFLRCPACAPVFRARQPTLDHKKPDWAIKVKVFLG